MTLPLRRSASVAMGIGPSTPPPLVWNATAARPACCSLHSGEFTVHGRTVDRSYSSGIRVAAVVLSVPIWSRPIAAGLQVGCEAG